MTCHAIKGSQPENGLVSAFLDMLPAHAGNLGAAAKDIVKNQALDLFSVSWAQTMEGRKPRVSSARGLALLSLHAAIGARLADPALDAQIVAAAAGVSVRYANALLAEQDMSIMRLVHAKRLEQCPKGAGRPAPDASDDKRDRIWLGLY
jgi:AraC family transcriptional regulator, positive regulator of tynA and feaB